MRCFAITSARGSLGTDLNDPHNNRRRNTPDEHTAFCLSEQRIPTVVVDAAVGVGQSQSTSSSVLNKVNGFGGYCQI